MQILISQTAMMLYKEFFDEVFPSEEIIDELNDFLLEKENQKLRQIKYDADRGCTLYIQKNKDGDFVVIGAEKL